MSNGRKIRRPVSTDDVRAYEREWAKMMVDIWREKILRLRILNTGSLASSLSYRVLPMSDQINIVHEFLLYGIYVARGVGNGYRRGNSGVDDENGLRFLGKSYRKAHKMGKPRKKRDWFTSKYLSSIHVLTEVEIQLYGNAYLGTMSNVVHAMFGNGKVVGSSGTDVSATIGRF